MTSGCSVLTNTATRHSGMPLSTIRWHSSDSTSSDSDPDRAPSVSQSTTLWTSDIAVRLRAWNHAPSSEFIATPGRSSPVAYCGLMPADLITLSHFA